METTVRKRAGAEGRWDLVAEMVNARLEEMKLSGRWSGRVKDLESILGPHENNIRRMRKGEPWNHDDTVRMNVSRGLGWAPDGIDRLAQGDRSGAEVVEDDSRPWSVEFASGRQPDDLTPEQRRAYEWHLEQARKLLEGDQ